MNMIELFEQFGYSKEDHCENKDIDYFTILQSRGSHKKWIPNKGKAEPCYVLECSEGSFFFQTSYFVGIDWIVEGQLSIYVQPKQNKDDIEVDYIGMLLEALQEPENLNYIEGLVHIEFDKPYVPITQKQDLLSPFLVAQFLQVLKKIVQKGLKKSYYTVTDNLNARVKGKILVGRNIKENLIKGRQVHTICQYLEFGINSEENQILKKAYQFSRCFIQQNKNKIDFQSLLQLINYIHPAFETVSEDIDIHKLKKIKSNPLFKEYDIAIKLASLILKRFSYNITKTEQEQIITPPFWIDMSKLFELYVYKKLRSVFSSDEVVYHVRARQNQELDFLLKSQNRESLFVIDTKYKPRYREHSISLEDIRQLSGYARLEKVYDRLSIPFNQNINCLVIYSHQDCDKLFETEHFIYDETNSNKRIQKEKGYVDFYKLGIKLPVI